MTMRMRESRNVMTTLAVFAVLFDQGDAGLVKAQNLSSVPDVRRIVESSIAATLFDEPVQRNGRERRLKHAAAPPWDAPRLHFLADIPLPVRS